MKKYKVPIRVNVAPVQTYLKVVTIEAASRRDVQTIIRSAHFVSELTSKPGWKSVGGRLEAMQPDKTTYDTYLDEEALDEWIRAGD